VALRGDAFRKLGMGELRAVGVRRTGGRGGVVVGYDVERAVAMIDVEHPAAARVLQGGGEAGTGTGGMYVILAAVFGAVNRALERISDEDEAAACGALLEYLAANPGIRL
jgi:hypothetical protein